VPGDIRVELGTWDALRDEAVAIRYAVFVDEQHVPVEEEIDAMDPLCVHALARDTTGRAVATGRLLPDGHIGRMAVLARARGTGVGSDVLVALMEEARRRGHREVPLSAQTHAIPFYTRHGYAAEGEIYDDCGIPHVWMRTRL
jgi:predicted GNAT family N-acyltransferase